MTDMEIEFESLEHVAVPVFALGTDPDHRPVFTFWNAACAEEFGLHPRDVIGQTAIDLFPGPSGQTIYGQQLVAFSTHKQQEFDFILEVNGQTHEYRAVLIPFTSKS